MVRVISPGAVVVSLDDGRQHRFVPGEQDAPLAAARHWFAAANGVRVVEPGRGRRRKSSPAPPPPTL